MANSQQKSFRYSVLIPQLALPWLYSSASAVIAYGMRDYDVKYRFVAGIGAVSVFAKVTEITNAASRSMFKSEYINQLIWTASGLLSVSFSAYFGANKYYEKHGIDSYRKAIINSLCSGQAYFRKNENARKKALKNLLKFAGYTCASVGLAKIIKSGLISADFIRSNFVLQMQTLMLMSSLSILSSNIPANLNYLIFGGNDDIEVVEPYEFVYFLSSIREFWKSWSRPAGELLRWMVYEPLGGRDRYWLSVPALFATNCYIHYDVWERMFGDRAVKETNKAFVAMGSAMVLYMLTENIFLKKEKMQKRNAVMDASQLENVEKQSKNDDNSIEDSVYWKIWSFGLFHASMGTALYILKDKPMKLRLENFCNENLRLFET